MLSIKTKLLRSIDLQWLRGMSINTNSFEILENHYHDFWLYYVYINFYFIFSSEAKKLFACFDTEQNRLHLKKMLKLAGHLIFWSENDLRLKFKYAQM